VMPDTDGGGRYSLQCLNDPHGLQDMTFVGREVPSWAAANLRVQLPGLMWGVAGYSEGGFCAANIGLQDAISFGYAGVLSGYFAPLLSQVPIGGKPGGRPHDINVYAHNPSLALRNTPNQYILHVPIGILVPQFFLAVGAASPADVSGAEYFRQLLMTRVADVPIMIVRGAGHQAVVWRAALAPMLKWMTLRLAGEVQHFTQVAAHQADVARAAKAAHARAAASARARKAAHRLPPEPPQQLSPRPTA